MFMHSPFRNFFAVGVFLLAACAATPEAGSNQQRILESHHWRLESAIDGRNQRITALSPHETRPIVLGFAGDRMSIQGGCNQRGGRYRITAASQLEVDRMVSTMMACEPELMQTDTALSSLFAKPLQIGVIDGASPRLRLVTASNESVVFTGSLTREAQYGPPTVMFLEVAPKRVACSRPQSVGVHCLQIRELRFDQQGLPVGKPGEWQPLYEDIEGFAHTEGVRNVLRLKRFNRASASAGASANVYVLDLVVQSEQIGRLQ